MHLIQPIFWWVFVECFAVSVLTTSLVGYGCTAFNHLCYKVHHIVVACEPTQRFIKAPYRHNVFSQHEAEACKPTPTVVVGTANTVYITVTSVVDVWYLRIVRADYPNRRFTNHTIHQRGHTERLQSDVIVNERHIIT